MNISTFLTFVGEQYGKAEEAINCYVSIFPDSEIKSVTKYAEGEQGGDPGHIKYAEFVLNGTDFRASESSFDHKWGFSPGVSIMVQCDSEEQLGKIFGKLSEGGMVMMPVDDYGLEESGVGKLFGWCADKYGVNWQLSA